MTNVDNDPLNDWCGACGARPGQACAPDCPSRVRAEDDADRD